MKSPEISDWETDQQGRRFRKIGGCIEYEPEISVNGVMIPVSQADAVRKRMKEDEERARKERAEAEAKLNKLGSCPFSKGMSSKCRIQCAFYSEEGCMKSPETKGRRCPISNYGCSEDCMLYDNGCQLIKKWRE